MLLKTIIVVLFIAVVASLSSGVVFLLKDIDVSGSRRTAYILGVRVTLATVLMAVIAYGIHSGQLGNKAPWGQHRSTPQEPIQ